MELEQPSGVSKNYSSVRILSGTCSTVLLKPASVLLNAKTLVQSYCKLQQSTALKFLFQLMKDKAEGITLN